MNVGTADKVDQRALDDLAARAAATLAEVMIKIGLVNSMPESGDRIKITIDGMRTSLSLKDGHVAIRTLLLRLLDEERKAALSDLKKAGAL